MSEPITFERDGVLQLLWVDSLYGVALRPATSEDLAAAGFIRAPSVEELAKALYSVEDLAATTYGADLMPWERRSEETRTEYREMARAVLRALGVTLGADA